MAQAVEFGNSIQSWTLGREQVSLEKDPIKENYFTYQDARTSKPDSFEVTRFCPELAIQIIHIFHEVIAKRLEKGTIDQSTFLPICYEKIYQVREGRFEPLPDFRVALFGRVISVKQYDPVKKQDETKQKAQEVSWAICREANGIVLYDESARMSNLLEDFICNAPKYNRPDTDPKLNKMDSYLRNFRFVVDRGESGEFNNVELSCCSLLDRNIFLDRNFWAITLVSTNYMSPRGESLLSKISSLFDQNVGHAMLACEGVTEDGKPFLKYVHLTQSPQIRKVDLQKNEGQFDILENKFIDTINGPTWSRSHLQVENMLKYVRSMEGRPVKFALYGSFFQRVSIMKSLFAASNEELRRPNLGEFAQTAIRKHYPSTCLQGAIQLAEQCGVLFIRSSPLRKPLEKVAQIQQAPICSIPEDFDFSLLGRPFPQSLQVFNNQFLGACIVLLPMNCTEEDIDKWNIQWILEDTSAVNREMDRMMSAGGMPEIRYTPKTW